MGRASAAFRGLAAPALSVVVPAADPASADVLLGALAKEAVAAEAEVILVVDGSSGGPVDPPGGIRLFVLHQVHSGLAAARNLGWRAAKGRIVLFLDVDLVPEPGLLAAHLALHRGHGRTVVLGCVAPARARLRSPWAAYEDHVIERKQAALGHSETPSGIHDAAHFSISRRLLLEAHGFDVRLPHNEEVDLGFRLRQMGARFVYEPRARAIRTRATEFSHWALMHRVRGRLDVAMFRERGYAGGLPALIATYHDRHLVNRLLVRAALGSRSRERTAITAARRVAEASARLAVRPLTVAAASVCANTLYWSGVRDGIRSDERFWRLVHETSRDRRRPYVRAGSVRA